MRHYYTDEGAVGILELNFRKNMLYAELHVSEFFRQ